MLCVVVLDKLMLERPLVQRLHHHNHANQGDSGHDWFEMSIFISPSEYYWNFVHGVVASSEIARLLEVLKQLTHLETLHHYT